MYKISILNSQRPKSHQQCPIIAIWDEKDPESNSILEIGEWMRFTLNHLVLVAHSKEIIQFLHKMKDSDEKDAISLLDSMEKQTLQTQKEF